MEEITEFLKQLDLSDIEAKIYITLLESGPTTVRELAEDINIKRTTTYTYINQLIEKGLITEVMKGFHKQIAANTPESLQFLIEQKLETVIILQKSFPDILKKLDTIHPQEDSAKEAEIKYYKGKNGVRSIYEMALRANEFRSYVNVEEVLEVFPDNAKLFDIAIHSNPKMRMFEIVENSPQSRNRVNLAHKKSKRYSYKFFPKDVKITSTDILLYDGKISIINLKNKIDGLTLINTELYNNFKVLFDFIWRILPE